MPTVDYGHMMDIDNAAIDDVGRQYACCCYSRWPGNTLHLWWISKLTAPSILMPLKALGMRN